MSIFFPVTFRESRKERGDAEREKHQYDINTTIGCLLHLPQLGPGLTLQPRYMPLSWN